MFRKHLINSFIFCILLYVVFFTIRVIFVVYSGIYRGNIGDANMLEYIYAFYNGFRYDGQIIGGISSVFFVLGIFFVLSPKITTKILRFYALLVISIITFVGIANIGFYDIYGDTFNAILLGVINDDRNAILQTGLSSDFGILPKVILWLILCANFYMILKKIFTRVDKMQINTRFLANLILFGIFVSCMLISINGHFGLKAISLGSRIIPVKNIFLRKVSIGGFRDLTYVYKSYKKISHSSLRDYTKESMSSIMQRYFGVQNGDLSVLLEKHVENNNSVEISHIFYIIAESFSAWHLDDRFDEMGINSDLKSLINDGAIYIPILENAGRTIDSLAVQISGLYHIDIPLNLSVGKNPIFKTAPAYIFSDLGYESRFYYGGSGTWQKIDSYAMSQGFKHIFYNSHIIENIAKDANTPYQNVWGVFDHHLFDFIKNNTPKDKKTFSMIMTTSYHPPYDVPLAQFNPPFDKIDTFIANHPNITKTELIRKVFAHIFYQNKVITDFIKETSKALPNSLFIITGDHYDMKYPFNANLQISKSVPLIVYSPLLRPHTISSIGSHINITPTIVELVAPKAYKYISFGTPLLSNTRKNSTKDSAFGFEVVSNKRFFYNGDEIYYIGQKDEKDNIIADTLFDDLKANRALSWWIFKNGYDVK